MTDKKRITIQVFQGGKAVGEYVANVTAKDEQSAVDTFMKGARIDLTYRFLGEHGFITPSVPNDYLVQR